MKRVIAAGTILLLVSGLRGYSQEYKTGIGLRLGWESGVSLKHFMKSDVAIEGILGTRYWGGLYLCGLYEKHFSIGEVEGLSWYVGGGAHAHFWSGWGGFYKPGKGAWYYNYGSYVGVGIDGVIGLEYVIPGAPLSVGIDAKPFFELFEYTYFGGSGAITVRYLFQ